MSHSMKTQLPAIAWKARRGLVMGLGLIGAAAAWMLGLSWPAVAVFGLAIPGVAVAAAWALSRRGTAVMTERRPQAGAREAGDGSSHAALVGLLDIPALLLDENRRVLAWSQPCRELFPEIGTGRPLHQVSRNPDLLQAVQLASADRTARAMELTEGALRGRRMRVSVSPMTAGPGDPSAGADGLQLLVQFRDLSEFDRLARMRSEFIANASHELRTPLASIMGFIETLQGPASGDAGARRKFLAIMEQQAARMTRILDDLLSLSRIEMKAHVPPTGEVDVGRIVQGAVEGLEPIARNARITLSLNGTDRPCFVKGDHDELAQVFQNLIQNAIKYGCEGGRADVSIGTQPGHAGKPSRILIAVTDDGPGIAAEHLPRLTERFYRVDSATSRERGGTGLGLSIVKHILNRHRGELKITSEPGKGSTFTVILDSLPGSGTAASP